MHDVAKEYLRTDEGSQVFNEFVRALATGSGKRPRVLQVEDDVSGLEPPKKKQKLQ